MLNDTETTLYARTSLLYRANAMFQISICVLTILVSIQAFNLLYLRSVFHKSTRQLLFMSILYADFHAISYGFLQSWSLYRSLVHSTDLSHITFTGYECFAVTWTVGAAKMLMIFIQGALTIERIIDRIYTMVASSKHFQYQGYILNVLVVIFAFMMNTYSYSEGPTTTYKLQSCFMQRDIPLDRVLYALGFYFVLSLFCLIANILIISSFRRVKPKSFNLKVRFNIQEVKNSSLAVSIISAAQFVAMFIYVCSSYVLIFARFGISVEYFHNIILCVYTIPYAGLFLPVSVILCVQWISNHRKIKIFQMTNVNKKETMDARMAQLRNSWDDQAPPIKLDF